MPSTDVPTQRKTARFAAALSTRSITAEALDAAAGEALEKLGGRVDLAFAFVSMHHADQFGPLLKPLCQRLGSESLLACTGESIVGGSREVEGQPAIALWLAHLPGTRVLPMRLEFQRSSDGGVFTGWPGELPEPWPAGSSLLLLGDPFSFPADELIRRLNDDQPGVPVVGGMASGGFEPGVSRIWLGDRPLAGGAAAVVLHGATRLRSVVSQGCKPIGRPFVVTQAERNVIGQLGGLPALQRLQEVVATLSPEDQQRLRTGLHVGQVLSEYQDEFRRGDFLVRNVVGIDAESGAIAIGDYARVGQTVQFHLRDEQTADEDLRQLLAAAQSTEPRPPAGALLFTCNGRGTRLFSRPDHDAGCLQAAYGDLPLAGFFAQGELGPVGGKNYLHGFTASVALFDSAE